MNAIKYIQDFGVAKARGVVKGTPDNTATHYVFRKIPNYYSVEFRSWYHDDKWWDSDCYTEQDLIDSYGLDYVVNLSELKRLVESVELVIKCGAVDSIKDIFDFAWAHGADELTDYGERLKQAIADYESIYGGAE